MFCFRLKIDSLRCPTRVGAGIAALALSLALVSAASAQKPAGKPATTAHFLAYPLKHGSAVSARDTLLELLRGRSDVQVVADEQSNQLLVRGPADSQALAKQLVESIDKPSAGSGHAAGSASPVLRTYPYSGGNLQQAAERLKAQLPNPSAARITVDERLGQIVVLAPPQLQAQVATQLADGIAGAPLTAPRFVTQPVPLANSRAGQIEALLSQMFGSRLVRAADAPGRLPGYTLTAPRGETAQIEVDAETNQLVLHGSSAIVAELTRLVRALDSPRPTNDQTVRIVPLRKSDPHKVRQAFEAYRGGTTPAKPAPSESDQGRTAINGVQHAAVREPARVKRQPLMQTLFQVAEPPPEAPFPEFPPDAPPGFPPPVMPEGELSEDQRRQLRELGADVDIEPLDDLDVIILRGRERDVNELVRIIEEIERISAESVPEIEVITLKNANSQSIGRVLTQVQTELLAGRQGRALSVPLRQPNAVLVVGWGEAFAALKDLIGKLDQPIAPESQFRVFPLKHATAGILEPALTEFFRETGPNPTPRATVIADRRTNSLIIQGSSSDLAQAEILLSRLDVPGSSAVNQIRVFRLTNSLALDLAPALQSAISGGGPGPGAPGQPGGAAQRAESLELFTLDAQGERRLTSGTLSEVRITPEPRTNTLIVSAPPDSMDLIAALIDQLDRTPATTAQVKVFRIVNGDASRLVEMLQALLGTQAVLPGGPQLAGAEGDASLAPLRFSVDARTNSIIASGSLGDLTIVEAILLRLDDSDVQERRSLVYRLKNAPAFDVATAVNEYLRSERRVQQVAPGAFSAFQQIEAEVVVVPEPVSNSLIISATPRYYDEIVEVVERLDAEPPQVMIQVLIADIQLDNIEEFGIELGIQDSVLFDRSILSNILPTSATTPAQILSANQSPGFNFNDPSIPLGNNGSATSLATAPNVGTQGLTNFSLGRVSSDAGFGGLVLSASSENVSILIRALREKRRLDVLARPQVMTLDNQPAFIQVGQRVPRVASVSLTSLGQVNSIDLLNVGLILGVTPRISPDGMVVMEIDAERSEVGPDSEGIPVSTAANGTVIRSPRIDITTAQTTVSAADGQTIVLGGLITKTKRVRTRRVPYLSDIPVLGLLFRSDLSQASRNELLIILTPHVIRNESDADRVKQAEAARMSWCLGDVEAIQGNTGIHRRGETEMDHAETMVIYPDVNPQGIEMIDSPTAQPGEMINEQPSGPILNGMPIPNENLPPPGQGAAAPGGAPFQAEQVKPIAATGGNSSPSSADKIRAGWKLPAWPGSKKGSESATNDLSRTAPRPDATEYLPNESSKTSQ